MSRGIVLEHEGRVSRFAIRKLERSALYGRRRRVALDTHGEPCQRAALTRDGRFLLRSGMTAQGYVTAAGRWIPNGELVGLDEAGEPLPLQPGTLGVAQGLEEVPPQEVLDLRMTTTYMLAVEELDSALKEALDAGRLFRFTFNYRADFRAETAFLLAGEEGYFAVVGVPARPVWVEAASPPPVEVAGQEDDDDDDLDFEMF